MPLRRESSSGRKLASAKPAAGKKPVIKREKTAKPAVTRRGKKNAKDVAGDGVFPQRTVPDSEKQSSCTPGVRRVLQIESPNLWLNFHDTMTYLNLHRALQTVLNSCSSNRETANFALNFDDDSMREINHTNKGNKNGKMTDFYVGLSFRYSYGDGKTIDFKVTMECEARMHDSMSIYGNECFIPRCPKAPTKKKRDIANWKMRWMRFHPNQSTNRQPRAPQKAWLMPGEIAPFQTREGICEAMAKDMKAVKKIWARLEKY